MTHSLAPQAETDLDDIWLYVAKESRNIETANRLIDSITSRFVLLARNPYMGRDRSDDFGPGMRSHAVGVYVIVYCVENDGAVLILRVVDGRRDLEPLFSP